MECGFSTKVLTFPLPIKLAGYAAERNADRIHDPLCVQILIIKNDHSIFGIVSLDLIAIEKHLYTKLLDMAKPYGFQEANFMICATHTHSGIQGVIDCEQSDLLKGMDSIFGLWNEEVGERIVDEVEACLKESLANMDYSTMRMFRDTLSGIGTNRNDPALAGDQDVFLLEVKQRSGKSALLYRMACHPTVLDPQNKMVSADIVGAVRKELADTYDTVLFVNGSCGDISTRFTRKMSGFEEVERYGKIIATAIRSQTTASTSKSMETITMYHDEQTILLHSKPMMDLDQAIQQVNDTKDVYEDAKQQGVKGAQLRLLASRMEGSTANLCYAKRTFLPKLIPIKIHYQLLQDEVFVFFPLELYSQLSNLIKRPHLHFIGYANGYHLYLSDQEAHDKQFYEAMISPFARGEGERFILEVDAFIQTLTQSKMRLT